MGNKQSTTTPNADFLSFEEIQERRRLFLKYGIKLFLDAYELSISNYFHPSAKKPEVEENFKTEILEVITDETSEVLTAAVPIIGFLLGKSLKKGAEIYERRSQEKEGEKIAIIFKGYHNDREKFTHLLKLVFDRIFIHCNIQFGDVLIKPSHEIDLEKLIFTIAQDVVMRIFHYCEEKANPETPENLEVFLCKAFVIGNSEDSTLSKILTENFFNFFSKCTVETIHGKMTISQVLDKTDICFHATVLIREEKPSQFLYRRAFKHESKHDPELSLFESCKKEDYQMHSNSDHYSDLKDEDVVYLSEENGEKLDDEEHEEILQAIGKYLQSDIQVLKDMLNQQHDQIDEVADDIIEDVVDAKVEVIDELEKTKKEVLDCIKETVHNLKVELADHIDKLFETFQDKIDQQLQLQQKEIQKNIKEEIESSKVKIKNETIVRVVNTLLSKKYKK